MNDSRPGISKWLSTFLTAGLLAAGSAVAADSAGDAQAQAGELLRGNALRPAEAHAPAEYPLAPRVPDAQHSARLLLLGGTRTADVKLRAALQVRATPAAGWHRAEERRGRRDAQQQAQRLIEGRAV